MAGKNGTKPVSKFSCEVFPENGRSWIADITCLPNGSVAIVDKWKNKLKVFDKFYRHKTTLIIPGAEALAAVARDTLVTLGDNQIRVYSTRIGITDVTIKKRKFKGNNFGVAFNGQYFAIIYENDNGYIIYVLKCDKNGELKVRRKVRLEDNFEISKYIAMEGRSNKLFIGDITNNSLVCLSTDGTVKWKRELTSWPRGLLVVQGKVLVATFFDHKIHCWTTRGEYIGVVLDETNGIYFPLKLVHQRTTNRLLVQCDYYGDIKVYDLSSFLPSEDLTTSICETPTTDISATHDLSVHTSVPSLPSLDILNTSLTD